MDQIKIMVAEDNPYYRQGLCAMLHTLKGVVVNGSAQDGVALLELLKEEGVTSPEPAPDAYAIIPDATVLPRVMQALHALRAQGVAVQMHAGTGEGMGSMKSQFKRADGSGAAFALVFGPDELAAGEVTIKALRDGAGAQTRQPLANVAAWAGTLKSTA